MELYRYELNGDVEDFTDYICLNSFKVIKETPKGYWIEVWRLNEIQRWCAKDAFNSFAYTSKKRAKENYIARTEKRLRIHEYNVKQCKSGLDKIKEIQD